MTALDSLKPRHAQAVELARKGHAPCQIAELMKVAPSTATQWLSRARTMGIDVPRFDTRSRRDRPVGSSGMTVLVPVQTAAKLHKIGGAHRMNGSTLARRLLDILADEPAIVASLLRED